MKNQKAKNAETLVAVHTHTHTRVVLEKEKMRKVLH